MNAAIKCIEDTLLIRRLQAREFSHDGSAAERTAAINEDIASLEWGLKILMDAGRQTTDGGPAKTAISGQQKSCSCAAPAIGNQQSKIENS